MKDDSPTGPAKFRKVATVANLYRLNSSETYYALVKRGGRQIRRSLRTKDFALAKRRLRNFTAEADHLRTGSGRLTFEALAEQWLASIRGHLKLSSHFRRETAVKALQPFFGGVQVRAIGPKQIESWKSRRGNELSPRTWNLEIETLRLMLDYAKDDLGILLENPAERIKRRKLTTSERPLLSKDQFRLLLGELRNGHRATGEAADLVELMAYSGLRQSEATSLRWSDINWGLESLRVTGGETGTKNHEQRVIPLYAPLRRLLSDRLERRMPKPPANSKVFTIRSARMAIVRACERLGFPQCGHHTWRHFFITGCVEAGIDFRTIAGWAGHADGGVLIGKVYGHLRGDGEARHVRCWCLAPSHSKIMKNKPNSEDRTHPLISVAQLPLWSVAETELAQLLEMALDGVQRTQHPIEIIENQISTHADALASAVRKGDRRAAKALRRSVVKLVAVLNGLSNEAALDEAIKVSIRWPINHDETVRTKEENAALIRTLKDRGLNLEGAGKTFKADSNKRLLRWNFDAPINRLYGQFANIAKYVASASMRLHADNPSPELSLERTARLLRESEFPISANLFIEARSVQSSDLAWQLLMEASQGKPERICEVRRQIVDLAKPETAIYSVEHGSEKQEFAKCLATKVASERVENELRATLKRRFFNVIPS